MNKIILASGSPRRKQLLELAEIPFEVVISNCDESYPEGLSPADTAMHIAQNKALAVQKNMAGEDAGSRTILAADTIVVLHNEIIGKPGNRNEAISILEELSGKTHQVITGVCIAHNQHKILFSEETEVTFYPLPHAQIEHYVDHHKPYDKAGAYAIQEWIGAVGIKSIKGDFYNVMGLPVSRIAIELSANW